MSQTVLITGASSGIGKAAATLFADRGWNVVATRKKMSSRKTQSFPEQPGTQHRSLVQIVPGTKRNRRSNHRDHRAHRGRSGAVTSYGLRRSVTVCSL